MYRWGFRLPDQNWVHSASHWLHGPDVAILAFEDDGPSSFFWSSTHLDELDHDRALMSRATALKASFDGAMYISQTPAFSQLALGELVDLDQDRSVGFYDRESPTYPFSSMVLAQPLSVGDQAAITKSQGPEPLMFKARTDKVTREMLEYVGYRGVNWTSLFALRDFMDTAGTDDSAIAALAGSSNSQMSRFRRTANSHEAVGASSRHGALSAEPPPRPMTIPEAADLIFSAAEKFIHAR